MMATARDKTRGRRRATARGSVRIGPISLFTLVAVLCLAVMAVLTVTTAEAMYAMTQRQAVSTTEGYAAENAGQELVGRVDAVLATARTQGATQATALSQVSAALPQIESGLTGDGVTVTAQVEGTSVTATVLTSGGRQLEISLSVGSDLHYKIATWKLTTVQGSASTGDTLWGGSSASTSTGK